MLNGSDAVQSYYQDEKATHCYGTVPLSGSRANAHTSGNAFAFCIQVLVGFDSNS